MYPKIGDGARPSAALGRIGSALAQAELAGLSGRWALAQDIFAGEGVASCWWSGFLDATADPNAPGFRQRVLTVLLSINDDYDGETAFPAVSKRWRGRQGTALFFWNVGPDGALDMRTLHAGLSVTRGEKWLLSQFIS